MRWLVFSIVFREPKEILLSQKRSFAWILCHFAYCSPSTRAQVHSLHTESGFSSPRILVSLWFFILNPIITFGLQTRLTKEAIELYSSNWISSNDSVCRKTSKIETIWLEKWNRWDCRAFCIAGRLPCRKQFGRPLEKRSCRRSVPFSCFQMDPSPKQFCNGLMQTSERESI